MIEVVFYGRGGQGAVTAAQILATSAFRAGKYAQAFPSFGPERRGATVKAYARIDDSKIVDRSPIVQADYVVVLDPNILKTSNPLNALKDHGCAVLNMETCRQNIEEGIARDKIRIFCVDATAISGDVYGTKSIPVTNVAMLGAFAFVSKIVPLDAILRAVDLFFSGEAAEKAKKTARMTYESIKRVETS